MWTPKQSTPVDREVWVWCKICAARQKVVQSLKTFNGHTPLGPAHPRTQHHQRTDCEQPISHSSTFIHSSGVVRNRSQHRPCSSTIPQKPVFYRDGILKLVPRWDRWFTVRGQCWKIMMLRRNKWATFQVPMGSCLIFTSWRPYNCTKVTRSTRLVQCTYQQHYKPQTASTVCLWFPPSLHLANCRNGTVWTTSVNSAFEHVAFMEKWGAARLLFSKYYSSDDDKGGTRGSCNLTVTSLKTQA